MATYKVPQDIEAEDKILGPLGIRQLVYVIIVAALGFVSFRLLVSGLWFVALPLLPPMILLGVLAAPLGHDQPTETWLIAKVRYFFMPRIRIWDQAGMKQLVTITVPKKEERQLTKGFSQTEVKSRLEALASTLDSRGWAVKNVNINAFSQPSFSTVDGSADRLIGSGQMAQQVPEYDIQAADDMLDEGANPLAHQVSQMVQTAASTYKQGLAQTMQQGPGQQTLATPPKSTVTAPSSPAILELAKTDDLSVAAVASQANWVQGKDAADEVEIPLR